MDYSGAGNYLTTPDTADLRLGNNWTIECFHKFKTNHLATTHGFIASKGAAGNLNNGWYFGFLASNKITFVPANNNTTGIYVTYAYATDTANWHHLSLNSVNGVVTLYVDGTSVGSCVPGYGALPSIYEGTDVLYVGGWNYGTTNIEGDYMDELIIVTGATIRTGNFTPPVAPF